MSPREQRLIMLGFLVFFAMQIAQIAPELQVGWPFSPYTLYRYDWGTQVRYPGISLYDDRGREIRALPANIMPVEFFVANRIVLNAYIVKPEPEKMRALSRILVDRLNTGPWWGVQGMYPPITPEPGARIVGLDVYSELYDTTRYTYGRPYGPARRELAHSYREGGEVTTP